MEDVMNIHWKDESLHQSMAEWLRMSAVMTSLVLGRLFSHCYLGYYWDFGLSRAYIASFVVNFYQCSQNILLGFVYLLVLGLNGSDCYIVYDIVSIMFMILKCFWIFYCLKTVWHWFYFLFFTIKIYNENLVFSLVILFSFIKIVILIKY